MAKVTSRRGRPKLKNAASIKQIFNTSPVKDYEQIVCPFSSVDRKKLPDDCYMICGLTCVANCTRFSDNVCVGCPCLDD